jgi:hypothetical protein
MQKTIKIILMIGDFVMNFFENKYIPLLDSITYTIEIRPKKVDPYGRIRTPEEIKNGTREFLHSIYIDKVGNVYIIPMKLVNGDCVEYYTHEDIIKAAMGDAQSRLLIENARNEIKTIFNKDLLSDVFMQRLYEQEKDAILQGINRHREEDGEPIITITMPSSPKTVNNFTPHDFSLIILTALSK